jgi:polyisoprenoid-binding protein YceI
MAQTGQLTESAVQSLLKDGALAGTWTVDESRSTVGLKSRAMWGLASVKGVFRKVTGEGTVSPAGDVSGTIAVDAASVDTKNTRRDTHLRSADFFDSDNHPAITFTADRVKPSSRGVTVTGTLSVRGRTRPLSLDATVSRLDDGEVALDGEVPVNRADFGLTWNQLGMVSMHNTIAIHAVFTRQ